MRRYLMFASASVVCFSFLSGCGGPTENTVSAPPATVMTMEEREAEEQAMRNEESQYKADY